jgi:hypothetical protein
MLEIPDNKHMNTVKEFLSSTFWSFLSSLAFLINMPEPAQEWLLKVDPIDLVGISIIGLLIFLLGFNFIIHVDDHIRLNREWGEISERLNSKS